MQFKTLKFNKNLYINKMNFILIFKTQITHILIS